MIGHFRDGEKLKIKDNLLKLTGATTTFLDKLNISDVTVT